MNCNKCGRENRSDAVFCDACGIRLGSEAASNGATGPLVGLRVLDWTMWQFGPVATMMLADLGAEVIKVESLDGDHARQFHRVSGAATVLPGGLNAYFESLNRQKKSIALDLKNPKGVKALSQCLQYAARMGNIHVPCLAKRLSTAESPSAERQRLWFYATTLVKLFGFQICTHSLDQFTILFGTHQLQTP